MTKTSMILVSAGIVLTAVLVGPLSGAVAGAQPASSPVGPNQAFLGAVNGASSSATIDVLCPGPARLNQRGYAASGQTIGIESPAATTGAAFGFTGKKADSIVAQLATPASSATAALSVTFTAYGNEPLPTTVLLPCSGRSTVVFVPRPTSKTARSYDVAVTFVPTCASTVCPVVRSESRPTSL